MAPNTKQKPLAEEGHPHPPFVLVTADYLLLGRRSLSCLRTCTQYIVPGLDGDRRPPRALRR